MAWILLFVNCVITIAKAVRCTAQGRNQAENNPEPGACAFPIIKCMSLIDPNAKHSMDCGKPLSSRSISAVIMLNTTE
jgi:hypothetical protein